MRKSTYLQSLLDGEARSVVTGLSLTADRYVIACDIMTKRLFAMIKLFLLTYKSS